jgi:hypothetical protein
MNTQVNSEAPAASAEPVVAVAQTAPVALTPIAAAVAPIPAAAPSPQVSKGIMDDFLDEDEPEEVVIAETLETDGSDDSDIIPDLEDSELPATAGDASTGDEDLADLEDLEEVAGEEQSMVVIDVFKTKCTDCTHLVPWGTKTHKRCHFSNGNDLCPAQSIRIRRHIPVDQIVARFMAAESQGDTDRLVTLYENLKKKAQDVQEEIHAALKAAREKKVLKAAEAS